MPGRNILTFSDFIKSTNEYKISGPRDLINDTVYRSWWLADAMSDLPERQLLQGGSTITDRSQLTKQSQFAFYNPGDTFTPSDTQTLTKLQAPWCFCKCNYSWTEEEIDLNEGPKETVWVDLAEAKREACWVDNLTGIENAIWTQPNQNQMESLGAATRPYSIPTFVCENGIQPAGWTTTIEQADPTQLTFWQNPVQNYASAAIDSTLVPAMETLHPLLNFKSPGTKEEYFRKTEFKKFKIYTNLDGRSTAVRLIRQNNDRNYPKNDAGWAVDDPVFAGIPISWVEALETYGYAAGQPRFFWINYQYLFPVWHKKRYMYECDPIPGGPTQPFSWVVYLSTWMNIFCRSRRRQGIIVPV